MKRFFAVCLIAVLMLGMFVGCNKEGPGSVEPTPSANQATGDSQEYQPPTHIDVPETTEAKPYVRETNEEKVAKAFVEALLNKDYEAALACLASAVDQNALVFTEDIEWAVPRTGYKDLSYFNPETTELTTTLSGESTVTVSLKDDKGAHQDFKVYTTIPDEGDGSPYVDGNNVFYVRSCTIRVPGGTKVSINDVDVPAVLMVERQAGKRGILNEYKFNYIGRKDKTLHIVCDNFDANELFTPTGNNTDPISITPKYDGDLDELHEIIANLWNDMYAVVNGEDDSTVSELDPYVAMDASADTGKTLYDCLKAMRNNKSVPEWDHRVIQVVNRPDSSKQAYWGSDHILAVNFGYEITWTARSLGSKSMKRVSSIILAKEDGIWKVWSVTDQDLFKYTNSMTSQW